MTTYTPKQVTRNSAVLGGEVIVRADSITISELGICVGAEDYPTIEEDLHWSTTDGSTTFVYTVRNLVPGIRYYVRAYAISDRGVIYGYNKSFVTIDEDYVDFDLPSGTLWATCNVGASAPEKYGSYFAWGEVSTKYYYNWNTYDYCYGSNTSLIKYCTLSSYGYVDNRTTLQIGDDAAHVNWGNGWHIPTKEQWEELQKWTFSTITIQGGVKGMEFSRSGKSIFLPFAGCYWNRERMDVGTNGYYWSNQLQLDEPDCAWYFDLSNDNKSRGDGYRSYGQSVRPVWGGD